MRPFNKVQNLFRSVYNVHFNLTPHFRQQLESPAILHPEDSRIMTSFILDILGESPRMRKYTDGPSQAINGVIKESILKPSSDTLLSAKESMDRDVIETSLELERKRRRYPLRALSTYNVFNSQEARENLVESHCCGIVEEGNKILHANIRNLLTKNLKGQESFDALAAIFAPNNIDEKRTISSIIFSDERLSNAKAFLSQEGIKPESSDRVFEVYDNTVKEAKNKRGLFQEKINEVKELQDEFGDDRLKAEFAKVRLLYAAEWLARAKLVGFVFSPLEGLILGTEVTSVDSNAFQRNLDKSAAELRTTFGKQVITTMLGGSINSSSRNKDGTNGRYMIACDTEFHDYLKFLPRVVATFMAGMAAHSILGDEGQEGSLAESATRDVVKIASRFVSGSHIGMRMLPQDVQSLFHKVVKGIEEHEPEMVVESDYVDKISEYCAPSDREEADNPTTEKADDVSDSCHEDPLKVQKENKKKMLAELTKTREEVEEIKKKQKEVLEELKRTHPVRDEDDVKTILHQTQKFEPVKPELLGDQDPNSVAGLCVSPTVEEQKQHRNTFPDANPAATSAKNMQDRSSSPSDKER